MSQGQPRLRVAGGAAGHGDVAGVDADARGQANTEAAVEFLVQGIERLLHLQRSSNSSKCVVFVRLGYAEHTYDGVADEFLNTATVTFDDRSHRGEVAGQELGQCFRVDRLSHCGRVDKIREQHGDRLALAHH